MSSSGSDGSDDEEDYEVEKITGHKRQDNEYVYKVVIVSMLPRIS